MAFPGYVKPSDLMIDAGVLYVSATPAGMGATRGGIKFDPGATMRNVPFDGKTTDIAGLDRITDYNAKITGKMIDLSGPSLQQLHPGSTSSDSGSEHIITPIDATVMLSAGDYLTDVTWIGRAQSGGTIEVNFPFAIVEKYSIAGTDKAEGEIDVSIKAVLGASETNLNACPFTVTLRDA